MPRPTLDPAPRHQFVKEEVEPLDQLGFSAYDIPHPARAALFPPLQKIVRDKGLWACHLGPELGGAGMGQFKLALMNIILGRSRCASKVPCSRGAHATHAMHNARSARRSRNARNACNARNARNAWYYMHHAIQSRSTNPDLRDSRAGHRQHGDPCTLRHPAAEGALLGGSRGGPHHFVLQVRAVCIASVLKVRLL